MSLHKRTLKSGATRYEVRWREDGKQRSRLFTDRQTARQFDREVTNLRQAGELAHALERRRLTVADLAADWWDRTAPSLAATTVDVYAVQLDLRLLPVLGAKRVNQLTVADVERWINRMRADGTGDPTILKAVTVLQALLTMAVRDGVVTQNVAQQARKPAQRRTRTPLLIRPAQVEAMRHHLLQAGDERSVVLLELLAYAGLRPESEAVTLPWRHVRDRSLLIVDTKRGKERTVPLLDPLQDTLNAWRLRRGRPAGDLLVVPTRADGTWDREEWRYWRRHPFRRAAVAAGLPEDVRPRDLRGSFVSLLVQEGRSIVEVARQLGHSPEVCLRDYAQVFDETDPADRLPAAQIIRSAREVFAHGSRAASELATNDRKLA